MYYGVLVFVFGVLWDYCVFFFSFLRKTAAGAEWAVFGSCKLCSSAMEEELQEFRELVAQLRADNEPLRQEPDYIPSGVGQGEASWSPARPAPVVGVPPSGSDGQVTGRLLEHLVVVPRERKCPYFNGKSGFSVNDWIEEAQACMRARHLSASEQALFFLFDHLAGDREEIRYRPGIDRGDPGKILYFKRAVCILCFVCGFAGGLLFKEITRGGKPAGIFIGLNELDGES